MMALRFMLGIASLLGFIGCLAVGPHETYGFAQLQFPEDTIPSDIGAFVYIEGGNLTLGIPCDYFGPFATRSAIGWVQTAKPPIRVEVPSFYLGKYEVTAQEYCNFLNEIFADGEDTTKYVSCDSRGLNTVQFGAHYFPIETYEAAPATGVSYLGARRYCEWMSTRTGETVRLPSEVEWEYAARGSAMRTYPWGEGSPLGRAFLRIHYIRRFPWGTPGVCTVGMFPEGTTPEGVHDLVGNALEWCGNYYFDYDQYVANPDALIHRDFCLPGLPSGSRRDPDGNPIPLGEDTTVARGGQYLEYRSGLIETGWTRVRVGNPLLHSSRLFLGFRVLKEAST
jgi:formylglycine-generating enzyme required for sulfatase activity